MNRMVTRRGGGDSREFYLPLIDAIRNGDWASVQRIHASDGQVVRASITFNSDTALMLAVNEYRQKIDFVESLINLLGEEDLARQNKDGNTALHEAVIAGYVEAAKLLVRRHRRLLLIPNWDDYLPLHSAVDSGQREILSFLLGIDEVYNNLLDFQSHMLTLLAIDCRLFDVAIYLLRKQRLARSREQTVVDEIKEKRKKQTVSLLETIAVMPSAFSSGTNLNIWERFIYDRVPLDYKNFEHTRDDEENPAENFRAPDDVENRVQNLQEPPIGCCCQFFSEVLRKLHAIDLWRLLKLIVPHVKQVQDKKLIHSYASDLVKDLCCELKKSSASSETLKRSFLLGAKHGIEKIIKEILVEFPNVIYCTDENERSAFHLAVIYHHDNVFNTILKQKRVQFSSVIALIDAKMRSALHLAVMCRNEMVFNIIIQQKGLPKKLLWEEDYLGNNILHMAGQMPYQPQLEVGHIALFFSITSTIVAFDSALYLMFSQATQYVILTPMIIASCIPAFLFAFFQFQVLLNMIKNTYGRSMFSPLNEKEIRKGRRF